MSSKILQLTQMNQELSYFFRDQVIKEAKVVYENR
jgi:hypothetical protein